MALNANKTNAERVCAQVDCNVIIFKPGDRYKKRDGTIIIVEDELDEFQRLSYSTEDGGGGHMGKNHWRHLVKL